MNASHNSVQWLCLKNDNEEALETKYLFHDQIFFTLIKFFFLKENFLNKSADTLFEGFYAWIHFNI